MDPSARPPRPSCRPGAAIRCGRPVLRSALKKEPSPQVDPTRPKTNPIEPIEVKSRPFKEMLHILRNRTHWGYVAPFQAFTAKNGPIFSNYAPSRTRIHSRMGALSRPCPKTKLECSLESRGNLARVLSQAPIWPAKPEAGQDVPSLETKPEIGFSAAAFTSTLARAGAGLDPGLDPGRTPSGSNSRTSVDGGLV
jgi:hypothetical protein